MAYSLALDCVLPFGALVLATICIYTWSRTSRRSRLPLPPGPPTSWFGGSKLPTSYQWLKYAEWKDAYGDLIYIRVLGNPVLVLNSLEAANELLDKRSGSYSSRPVRTMIVELMGWGWLFSTMPYGSWWRRHRSLFHSYFHQSNTAEYHPVQLQKVRLMLRNILHSPEKFYHHVRSANAGLVLSTSYGHVVADGGDAYVEMADKALQGLGEAGIFGTYLVDYLPCLKHIPVWMPGAAFQRHARDWRKPTLAMVDQPFSMVKERLAKGTASPCFVTSELDKLGRSKSLDAEHEQIIKGVAAAAYAAGSDTTVSAIVSFFLAMVKYPDVQARAQRELESVVGTSRLPDFSDKCSLPYIDAMVWEALRWNPVTPLGLAHLASEDDEYKGYSIPKGTTVLPNVWAILHDEHTYPQPLQFMPERFLDQKSNQAKNINELPHIAFGFGRRMCPGRWLAWDTVWMTIASTLSTFNISQALDKEGNPIDTPVRYTSSSLSRPMPFECSITARTPAAATLVEQTKDDTL